MLDVLKVCKGSFRDRKMFSKVIYNVFPVVSMSIFISTVIYWNNQNYGLVLSYEGKEIATVENEETIEKANQMMKQYSTLREDAISDFRRSLKCELKVVNDCDDSVYKVKDRIMERIGEDTGEEVRDAAGIYIDGELIEIVENENIADNILNLILDSAKINDENAQVQFVENIEIVNGLFALDSIKDDETAKDELLCMAGLKTKEVTDDQDKLSDENDCKIHVKTVKMEEIENEIAFDTIREPDDSLFEGEEKISVHGKNGKEYVINKVVYLNGKEQEREEISRSLAVKSEPEYILYGTKKKPIQEKKKSEKQKNGKLAWPVPYTHNITSKFGAIDGEFRSKPHTGIDISASGIKGKDIVAAADGAVQFAGVSKGYGNCVDIAHQNGLVTRYAHCEKINVKAGQKVTAEEKIASVGNTGNSTGYHTHFEVIEKGNKKNPCDYF